MRERGRATRPVRILSVVNDPLSPAGLVGDCVLRRGGNIDEICPDDGEALPGGHAGHDGLLVLGGPMDGDDDRGHPHFRQQLALIRAFHAEGKPVMGICLGAQLVARAFGKRLYRHSELEIGFTALAATQAAAQDPLLQGLGPAYLLMEYHQDTFDLPDDAVLLVTGERCRNQAFRVGAATYGFQFHFEATPRMVRSWMKPHRDFLARRHPELLNGIERQFDRHMAGQAAFARAVGERWLDLADARRGAAEAPAIVARTA